MGHFQKLWLRNNPEKVSIRGDHSSTHGGAMDLKIAAIIKSEIIHGENHVNEFTECASRNGIMRGST